MTVAKAKSIINKALGCLYSIERNSELTPDQARTVVETISILEAEYRAISSLWDKEDYHSVSPGMCQSNALIQRLLEDRLSFANSFVSSKRILSHLSEILKFL